MVEIASAALTARIDPLGAELVSLRDAAGRELMTNADPAFWTGHAPLLFPIVGRLNGGRYRLDGREYELQQHGFARRLPFERIATGAEHVRFRLTDTAETRTAYPFAFTLDAEYRLVGATLEVTITLVNTGDADMPASFGFHPAFAWPLPYGAPRADHRIVFADEEADAVQELEAGLIAAERPSPLDGRTLALTDALFDDDALIWNPVVSHSVRYGPAQGPALEIDFPEAPALGIWTKPGAAFICVEPWWGIADPAGFTGEIWDKPGILRLAPGETRSFRMHVSLGD